MMVAASVVPNWNGGVHGAVELFIFVLGYKCRRMVFQQPPHSIASPVDPYLEILIECIHTDAESEFNVQKEKKIQF